MPETVTKQRTTTIDEPEGSFEISSPHLQYMTDAVGRFTDEARLQVEDGLLKMLEVDAAHIAMFEGGAPLVTHEGPDEEIYLPVDTVKKALKPVPLGEVDPITVSWDDKHVELELPGGHVFTYGQTDTSGMTDPKIPNLNLPTVLEVNSRLIWDAVRRANNIGADHCEFLFDDQFTITGELYDELRHASTIEVEDYIRTGERSRSMYTTSYLRAFTCATAWQGHVRMELGNDYPIKLTATPGDASLLFMLAPRIEEA